MAVNVSESGGFAFNQNARANLPDHIRIGASADGKVICVQKDMTSRYTMPKGGRVKIPKLLAHIKSAGIILPTRYILRQENDYFIGELDQPKKSGPSSAKRPPVPKTPKRISKSAEEHIIEALNNEKRR